jgi:hypothetical protein
LIANKIFGGCQRIRLIFKETLWFVVRKWRRGEIVGCPDV